MELLLKDDNSFESHATVELRTLVSFWLGKLVYFVNLFIVKYHFAS